MSLKNTDDSWEEFVQEQQMIDVMSKETASIFTYLCKLADEYGYDRVDTIDIFCDMFQAIIESIDPYGYDTDRNDMLN